MNPEAQRIAIAETCGWFFRVDDSDITRPWHRHEGPDCTISAIDLPDYLNDLNSMNEAVRTLSDQSRLVYAAWLYRLVTPRETWEDDVDLNGVALVATAKADQHAEAFLHATGKWEVSRG